MTRYPNDDLANKGKTWTVKGLDSITARWKGDTLSDGGGLVGDVRENSDGSIKIAFKYGFKLNGKKVWHYCGIYPDKSLAEIRNSRYVAKLLIAKGVDPRVKKITDKIEEREKTEAILNRESRRVAESLTFNDLYDSWIKDGVARSDSNQYLIQTFNKHAIPTLGNIAIRDLTEQHLRGLYRSIIGKGRVATCVELSKDIGQMLRWAEKRKPWRSLMVDGNPSGLVEIKKLVPDDYTKERTRMLSLDELKKLKSIFDSTESTYLNAPNKYKVDRPLKMEVQLAMWICLSTLCRISELLSAEWIHIDFKLRTWFIPAVNTKGEKGKKRQQLVYLSDFALNQFKELKVLTGDTKWVFPARYKEGHVCDKSASKQIGDRQLKFKTRAKKLACRVEDDSLVLGDLKWTPHDLRRTGATMMQQLKVPRDVINLCQNHVIGTKVDRVYLLDDYADEKREAWYKLGDRLEAIFNAENVDSLTLKSAKILLT